MSDATAPAIGDNLPPVDFDALTERLRESHQELIARNTELLEALDRVPEEFESEETANKAADFIKQLQAQLKNTEAIRVKEKEPYLDGGRRVDGFFKNLSDKIEAAKTTVTKRLTKWQIKVAEEERRQREAEAAEAAERARKAREEEERAAAEMAAKAAAEAPEQDAAVTEAVVAEENRQAAEADAETARRAAEAKPADLSRTRSAAGSVASLKREWTFRNLDRAELDLNELRYHIPEAALEQAVRSFIKAGGRKLDGVEIYEDVVSQVR